MKRLMRLAAIAALSGSLVAVNASSVWAQDAGASGGAAAINTGGGSGGGGGAGAGAGAGATGPRFNPAGGMNVYTGDAAAIAAAVASSKNSSSGTEGASGTEVLTAAEKTILDDAPTDPASLARAVQQIMQGRKDSSRGLSPEIAGLVTSYAIRRNNDAAATITSTAVAVAKGNDVAINQETGVIVVTVVAAATATARDQAENITTAASTAAPDYLAAITQAAVTAAPERAADVTAAAIRTNPSQAAAVAKAAATAAPQQAAAITTAAVAAAPDQTTAITSDVSSVQGVNTQEVQTAGDTTSTESVDTTNDGFDDVAPVEQSAAQENPASPTTPEK